MHRPIRPLRVILVATALAGAAPAARAQNAGLTPAQRIYGLSLLWQEVNYNFAFFDAVPGLDWDSAYRSFLPRVADASSTLEYYVQLQRFLALLKDGHTKVFLPDSIRLRHAFDAPRVALREVQRRAFVENVDSSLAGVLPPGTEVVRIGGQPVADFLRDSVFPLISSSTPHVLWREAIRGNTGAGYGLLVGPPGTDVEVEAVRPGGRRGQLRLRRDGALVPAHWLLRPKARQPLELRWSAGVPVLALNTFNEDAVVAALDSVLPALAGAPALVLDIRANGGGRDTVVLQVLDRLLDVPAPGPAWRTRVQNATFRAWGRLPLTERWADQYRPYARGEAWAVTPPDTFRPTPRAPGARYAGRVFVLIGDRTQSAAENFLVYLHGQPRFTLVGRATMGTTGQPLFLDLPGGGRAWIVTKRNTYPDGRTYVGTGVLPDVPVEPTPADLRTGRDAALEQALSLVKAGKRATSTST